MLAVVVAAVGASATSASSKAGGAQVTNSNDSGAGSFRAAIDKANGDTSIGRIEFRGGLGPIRLESPVVYTGGQSLDVLGNGAILDGDELESNASAAFLAGTHGSLSVVRLTVRNAPREGLTYQVPTGASGLKKVVFVGVQILGNDGHGVLINDQANPDAAGDPDAQPPVRPDPAGSEASLEVSVIGSRFANNGFSTSDRDGLRVNEGGRGNLKAVVSLSRFDDNGADGVELDERGPGDAVFDLTGTQISRNGILDPADLDDGMDVDESDEGALIGHVVASSANDNYEEGWDFNENDAGEFRVDMTLVEASRNREEGIDFEEDDDFAGGGDLVTTLIGIKADGNGDDGGDAGLKIREKGDGNLEATVRNAQANDNSIGGISIREDATGSLSATVTRPTTNGNAGNGIDFDENAAGDVTAAVSQGSSSNNTGAGIRADQGGTGSGTLSLLAMTLTGNGGGPVAAGGVTVTP